MADQKDPNITDIRADDVAALDKSGAAKADLDLELNGEEVQPQNNGSADQGTAYDSRFHAADESAHVATATEDARTISSKAVGDETSKLNSTATNRDNTWADDGDYLHQHKLDEMGHDEDDFGGNSGKAQRERWNKDSSGQGSKFGGLARAKAGEDANSEQKEAEAKATRQQMLQMQLNFLYAELDDLYRQKAELEQQWAEKQQEKIDYLNNTGLDEDTQNELLRIHEKEKSGQTLTPEERALIAQHPDHMAHLDKIGKQQGDIEEDLDKVNNGISNKIDQIAGLTETNSLQKNKLQTGIADDVRHRIKETLLAEIRDTLTDNIQQAIDENTSGHDHDNHYDLERLNESIAQTRTQIAEQRLFIEGIKNDPDFANISAEERKTVEDFEAELNQTEIQMDILERRNEVVSSDEFQNLLDDVRNGIKHPSEIMKHMEKEIPGLRTSGLIDEEFGQAMQAIITEASERYDLIQEGRAIQQQIKDQAAAKETLESSITKVNNEIKGLNEDRALLEAEITTLNSDLTSIEDQLGELTEESQRLAEAAAINARVAKAIDAIPAGQSRSAFWQEKQDAGWFHTGNAISKLNPFYEGKYEKAESHVQHDGKVVFQSDDGRFFTKTNSGQADFITDPLDIARIREDMWVDGLPLGNETPYGGIGGLVPSLMGGRDIELSEISVSGARAELQSQINEYNTQIEELSKQRKTLEDQIKAKQAEIEAKQAEIEDKDTALTEKKQELEGINDSIADIEAQMATLNANLVAHDQNFQQNNCELAQKIDGLPNILADKDVAASCGCAGADTLIASIKEATRLPYMRAVDEQQDGQQDWQHVGVLAPEFLQQLDTYYAEVANQIENGVIDGETLENILADASPEARRQIEAKLDEKGIEIHDPNNNYQRQSTPQTTTKVVETPVDTTKITPTAFNPNSPGPSQPVDDVSPDVARAEHVPINGTDSHMDGSQEPSENQQCFCSAADPGQPTDPATQISPEFSQLLGINATA